MLVLLGTAAALMGVSGGGGGVLRTKASFFIEASAMLSRQSALHDQLWDGVKAVGAPQVMYSPWAPCKEGPRFRHSNIPPHTPRACPNC